MDPLVLLDTNVILAHCLDPAMDAKGKLAAEVFTILSTEGLKPHITESVRTEFETKLHHRVGQIADVARRLSREPSPTSDASGSSLAALEVIFAQLRKDAPEAAGALQLLESRLARAVNENLPVTPEMWTAAAGNIAVQSTALLAEIQRRFDLSGVEVFRTPSGVDYDRFRGIVPKPDLENIASAAGLAKRNKCKVIFVTLESPLHAMRDNIAAADPDVIITTPAFLQAQISRRRAEGN